MQIEEATDSDFKETRELHTTVVLIFYTDWCKSCKKLISKVEKIAKNEEYEDLHFIQMNAEENPITRKSENVAYLPYVVLYKNGKVIEGKHIKQFSEFKEYIERLI